MKKFLALAALVLGMVSCQQDYAGLDVDANGEAAVTVSVAIPEMETRAGGNDSAEGAFGNIDLTKYDVRYILEVYDHNGALAKERLTNYEDEGQTTAFNLRLIPDRAYRFVVWADFVLEGKKEDLHYDTENLRKIEVIPTNWALSDESRDAYTGYHVEAEFSNSAPISIELKRPLGKLRVVTTDVKDMYKLLPKEVKVEYTSEIYTVFNAYESDVDLNSKVAIAGKAGVEISKSKYAGEWNGDVVKEGLTLFTDYFFAAKEQEPINFTLDVTYTSDLPIQQVVFNTPIPIQRNYLTTVTGPILTDSGNITVEIKDAFEGAYSQVETTASFADALKEAEGCVDATIDLTGDVTWVTGAGIGSTPLIPEGAITETLTINGNGHKVIATGSGVGQIRMANGGKLVFNNVKFVDESVSYAENSWEYGYLEFGGKLEFNNCQFVNAVMMSGDSAVFNECSLNSHKDNEYAVWVDNGNASFVMCAFKGPRAIKVHEAYGSEVGVVVVDNSTFTEIAKKPGMAIGDVNADTAITIQNSLFYNCQAGDQGLYIYETDTDVTTFNFTLSNNDVVFATESNDEFKEALENGIPNFVLGEGEFDLPSALNYNQADDALCIVGVGADKTTVNGAVNSNGNNPGNYAHGLDLVFEDLTFETANNGYNGGFGHAKSVTFRNCKIVGQFYAHSGAPHYFYDCTIDPLTGYLYTYASNCVFEGCTFTASEGKALQIYEDAATGENTVTITDCAFVAAKQATTWDGKPVTGIDVNSNGAKFTVYINNCTSTGFPQGLNSKNNLWNVKDGGKAHAIIFVDGEKVWDAGYEYLAEGLLAKDGEYYISSAAGLTWFSDQLNNKKNTFAGKTVKVVNDIDMTGATYYGGSIAAYPSYCFKGIFDGGEKIISNLTITVENDVNGAAALIPTLAGDGTTIKNVILKNVNISSSHYAGGIWGYTTSDNCWINVTNCHVMGGTITGNICNGDNADKVGGIGGIFYNGTVNNCSVKNVTISGYRDIAGIVGWAADTRAVIKNNSLENVTINVNNTTNYKNYTNRAQYDVNNYVGEGVGKAKLEGNTGEATINWGSIAE